ncbi:N-acetylneuraminate synthase [Rheinheimera sp. 1928-s]|uniref:N-acetylneuraminate synthase n=1 Tax=Rheinheimera sp. 1928-s TaxID=3033803 RepID=UPI002632BAEF|nr:N-acetylneuraminate synthase [Rheinheimera sp. 1928-s]MDF3125836.1 N-acetylneuraminate synthase [Rheinheimera sp. 1928-s]
MSKTFVIAEAGVNHNGDADLAFALVDAAAQAGADAVKFQTFQADLLATRQTPKAQYQKELTDASESQWQMLKRLELPQVLHHQLKDYAEQLGLEFMSTGFDLPSTEFLLNLQLKRYKIPSGELTNAPLVWLTARSGKPLILSTGMATLGEIELALAVVAHASTADVPPAGLREVWQNWSSIAAQQNLKKQVTLLHCTSQYPCPDEQVNLAAMTTLAQSFQLPVGYSDHSDGLLVPVAAVARGATIIEKHFTLDRNLPGPDHKASLTPGELKDMVQQIRRVELLLGSGIKAPQAVELDTQQVVRQRIVAKTAIAAGQTFTAENLTSARSCRGTAAIHYWDLLGQTATCSYQAMDPVTQEPSCKA